MEELFKSVKFGGYDKEEVLEFIKTKLESYETKENELSKQLEDSKTEIESLKENLTSYEEKLASTLVENQRLTDVITHHETLLNQEYSKNQIINTLVTAKNMSEKLVQEAENKSENLLKVARSKAFQEIRFKTDGDVVLKDYEKRFKALMDNILTLSEISSILVENVNILDKSLKEMETKLPLDIKEND